MAQVAGQSVVSVPRVFNKVEVKAPALAVIVSAGWLVSVHSLQAVSGSPLFVVTARGARFVPGAALVVPATEADHAPSPSTLAARTCTR